MKTTIKTAIFIFMIFVSKTNFSQNNKFYLSTNLGTFLDTNVEDEHFLEGFASGFEIKFEKNNIPIIVNLKKYYELIFFEYTPNEYFNSYEIMTGYKFETKYFNNGFYTGLAYLNGIKRGKFIKASEGWFSNREYEKEKVNELSIPIEYNFMITPGKRNIFGIGLSFFGNLNLKKILLGAGIKTEFRILNF